MWFGESSQNLPADATLSLLRKILNNYPPGIKGETVPQVRKSLAGLEEGRYGWVRVWSSRCDGSFHFFCLSEKQSILLLLKLAIFGL